MSYASLRMPASQAVPRKRRRKWPLVLGLIAVLAGGWFWQARQTAPAEHSAAASPAAAEQSPLIAGRSTVDPCAQNTARQKRVIVSISRRHLWACQGPAQQYDSPVVTGITYLAADVTPTGTYRIYGKYANTVLNGHDSTGSWSDPVSYWMPWLHNQYGSYGFHDATWRQSNDFGHVDPNSSDASHGCVELPLASAKWLYTWASIGTTVTIEA